MRRRDLFDAPDAVGLNGHVCMGYKRVDDLAALEAFLTAGLDLGQRLMRLRELLGDRP